ncbi:hypothetical protein BB560_001348 [Smittium megazygosporum]|uniref:Mediator complex subunit 8 n=1 Tax=Smittium megazygosporum TaxID=133381 RepID=A0A2T9ZHU7_9FUNG|nr:hypothetical protein BB560_001348 [Smittium megazygosporum]
MDLKTVERGAELAVLKNKLILLIESFDIFLQSLQKEIHNSISWNEILVRFNILAAKYSSLIDDVTFLSSLNGSSSLNRTVVFPGSEAAVPFDSILQQKISVLLRSKLTPKLEQAEKLILNNIKLFSLNNPNNASQAFENTDAQSQQLKKWKNLVEIQDTISLSLFQSFSKLAEENLKPRITSGQNLSYLDDNSTQKVGDAVHHEDEIPLEHIIRFISSGIKPEE